MKKKAVIGLFTSGAVLAGLIAATAIPALAEEGEPSITDEAMPVTIVDIDIKSDSEPSPINNNVHGVFPVVIYGSEVLYVANIELSTIELDGMPVKMVGKADKQLAHFEDINSDGYDDLIIQIQDEVNYEEDATEAFLTGVLEDGTSIEGTDYIRLVPNNG